MTSHISFTVLGRAVVGVVLGVAVAAEGALANLEPLPRPAAATATAFDDVYLLGPGDVIGVSVFNVPEYSGEQQVLANGKITLPLVGQLAVAGLTLPQAEQAISELYRPRVRYPQITVSLLTPRQLRITISGEIYRPGVYTMAVGEVGQFPTLVDAIQLAGGITQAADMERVSVQRYVGNGQTQQALSDLSALIGQGDGQQNIPLRDGDSIVITQADAIDLRTSSQIAVSNLATDAEEAISVVIIGEVFRPGTYNYASRSSSSQSVTVGDTSGNTVQQPGRLTVTRALRLAGGIRPLADLRRVEVKRTTRSGDSRTISLDLWQLVAAGEGSQDLVLQAGDTVVVPTAADASPGEIGLLTATNLSPDTIRVNVVGEVERPGSVTVAANTTLNQAVLAAGGFNRRARETVELIRLNPNGTITQRAVEIDLAQGLNLEGNPIMQHNDIVVVAPSATARLSDGLNTLLGPFLEILPIINGWNGL
ncbi:polysaccharide biosynthesis/export family protein [Leptothoe sp. PORK10 BA2]|uniref:polysaccharide biosynthesis/export family protein n=1 Tax=Leptothoe sp. PORK10 BA2 TaxID=3110254 RepID=UPI002B206B55|nr:SLBB domain-containing protein [Leptothoe sp. PORK10 BA2]MEA5466514.1 SLBB domain-containing protein [Leptothoe sp. PORK10 BA2]